MCVLFTANDAHMRDYEVIVPRDCIASNSKRDDVYTLTHLSDVLGIHTPLSKSIRF
jgi:nicotinamidase-related amidase